MGNILGLLHGGKTQTAMEKNKDISPVNPNVAAAIWGMILGL